MTPERLARFAEMVNKKWPKEEVRPLSSCLQFQSQEDLWFGIDDTDAENSKFIIWGLDRLEEMYPDRSVLLSSGFVYLDEACELGVIGKGDTRAEAVFDALYATLEASNE